MSLTSAVEWTPGWRSGCICCGVGPAPLTASVIAITKHMGASLSWFAVRGKTPEAVLQGFGLKNVGKEYCKTPFCGGALPSGWYLVIHGRHEFANDEARRLSRGCEVIACFVEEHVMLSSASGWKD